MSIFSTSLQVLSASLENLILGKIPKTSQGGSTLFWGEGGGCLSTWNIFVEYMTTWIILGQGMSLNYPHLSFIKFGTGGTMNES